MRGTRRRLLAGLASLTLAGCLPRAALPPDGAVLGWRLVPGEELLYAATTSRDGVERVEHWVYRVRDVEAPGTAVLEARLVGFGVPADDANPEQAAARDLEEARLSATPVRLRLTSQGHLEQVEAGPWDTALVHRLLGLRLPSEPVTVGSAWSDEGLVKSLALAFPPEVQARLDGTTSLSGWDRGAELAARLSTEAQATALDASGEPDPEVGPIEVRGEATWEVRTGRLRARTVTVTWEGVEPLELGLVLLD